MDILKLLELGATVGLHGRGLCDFIKAEREKEHASRVLEIEIARKNSDSERLFAREKTDKERLIARKIVDRENDERDRKRSKEKAEFEIEMQLLEKQIELERLKANNNNRNASHETLGANEKARMARPIIE